MVYGTMHGEMVGSLRYLAEVLKQTFPSQDIVVIMLQEPRCFF